MSKATAATVVSAVILAFFGTLLAAFTIGAFLTMIGFALIHVAVEQVPAFGFIDSLLVSVGLALIGVKGGMKVTAS